MCFPWNTKRNSPHSFAVHWALDKTIYTQQIATAESRPIRSICGWNSWLWQVFNITRKYYEYGSKALYRFYSEAAHSINDFFFAISCNSADFKNLSFISTCWYYLNPKKNCIESMKSYSFEKLPNSSVFVWCTMREYVQRWELFCVCIRDAWFG